MMELPLSENRRMKVDEFDSGKMLAHAAKQAKQRNYDQFPIVDVDSHHYELESFNEILEYMPDPVMKQLAQMANSGNSKGVGVMPGGVGYQDMGGRVTRYPLRRIEKPEPGVHRDVSLTRRWMDAMGVDIAVLFPSPMLQLGLHPQVEAEVALATAYNRWLAERVLAEESAHPLDDLPAVQRSGGQLPHGQGVRRQEGRLRLHGDVGALQAGAPQQLHEGLFGDRGDRPAARVPRRLQLERTVDDDDEQVHLRPCAGLRLVQHGPPDQLGAERAARALPQAQGDLDRDRASRGCRS